MNKQENSFTLIELLVVIAIVGILAGILIVSMTGATNNANDARRKADINQLVNAITIIKTQDGTLPAETNSNCKLGSTVSAENCSGIQARLTAKGMTIPKDPTTGNYYVYNRVSADDFTLTGTMSDSSSYTYDSSTSKYSSSSLTNGACGTSNNTITATTPTNTCSAGTSSSVTTDSNTVLLMHMDGTDNGTTFADQTGKTITRNGDTKTVTATKKFGTASAYFDGSGDYLLIPTSSDLTWNGDFTVDLWVNFSNLSNPMVLFADANDCTGFLRLMYNGNWDIAETSTSQSTPDATITTNTWYHMAIVRTAGNIKLFKNGTQINTNWNRTTTYQPDSGGIRIGSQWGTGGLYMNGYIDEFRISKGIARWTSNFSVASTPYYWWNWQCNGLNGGTNATCGADKY